MPVVAPDVLARYAAFSLYNSPYGAHDDGRAIDCYPEPRWDEGTDDRPAAPSPVAGEVVAVEHFGAPAKPYAPPEDVVLAIDTGASPAGPAYATADGEAAVARLLHVDPAVEVGDRVAVGDDLGVLLRSGFFAPWVDPHLHLEFRPPGADRLRAGGSLPLDVGAEVRAVPWDGRGTVTAVGETYAILDRPRHPAPGEAFAALCGTVGGSDGASGSEGTGEDASDSEGDGENASGSDGDGATASDASVPLDGGLPHYEFGGLLARPPTDAVGERAVSLLGESVGRTDGALDRGAPQRESARHAPVHWNEPVVTVDGEPIHGLSLAAGRDECGAKLVCPDRELAVGETVQVAVER